MAIDKYLGKFTTGVNDFDINSFIQYLTIFENVVFENSKIIPQLFRAIGYEGVKILIGENILSFSAGAGAIFYGDFQKASFGQEKNIKDPYIWFLDLVYSSSKEQTFIALEDNLSKDFKNIEGYGCSEKEIERNCQLVLPHFDWLDFKDNHAMTDFRHGISNKNEFVNDILYKLVENNFGLSILKEKPILSIELLDKSYFRLNTNLHKLLNISKIDMHNKLRPYITSIPGTTLRLGAMEQLEASAGLREAEMEIMSIRLNLFSNFLKESNKQHAFSRILELKDIPAVTDNSKVDIEELIKIIQSEECKNFRECLKHTNDITTAELEEALNGWKTKISNLYHSEKCDTIKWISITVVGSVEPISGIALGATDQFILKNIIPKPGPLCFLDRQFIPFIEDSKGKLKK